MSTSHNIKNKIIRVFISSTFDDFKTERDILNKKVLPEIKKECQRKGFVLQVVDLRFGVPVSASKDHTTMKICLEEIERCQKTGYYLNFLMLVGDRYGWMPLPSKIELNDYKFLLDKITNAKNSLDHNNMLSPKANNRKKLQEMLNAAYFLDENCLFDNKDNNETGAYVLKNNAEIEQTGLTENDINTLNNLFLDLSLNATNHEDSDRINKYFFSATGQEIVKGMLEVDDPELLKHIICFFRKIPTENSHINQKYTDCNPQKAAALEQLKERIIKHASTINGIDEKNVPEIITTLTAKPNLQKGTLNKNYLKSFEEKIKKQLYRIVEESMKQYKENAEQSLHADFALSKQEIFFGHSDDLKRINEFLTSENNNESLYLITGESGMGKTTFMAKSLQEFQKSISERKNSKVSLIYRFIGATSDSSSPHMLVKSLQKQICLEFDIPYVEKDNYNDSCNEFSALINIIPRDKKLVMFIDAVDQLNGYNYDYLKWIPGKLPNNVKFVISCLKSPDLIPLSQLRKKLRINDTGKSGDKKSVELPL
nr:DUF4062 domain-containing protein [Bacteroidaceae bacterium]